MAFDMTPKITLCWAAALAAVLLTSGASASAADAAKAPPAAATDPHNFEGTWTDLPTNSRRHC